MDIETQLEKASKASESGRIWESQKIYDDIIDFDPDCEPAIINKAIIFLEIGNIWKPKFIIKIKKK